MKKLSISRCSDCKYLYPKIKKCRHPKGKDEKVRLSQIPEWCPLPGFKSKDVGRDCENELSKLVSSMVYIRGKLHDLNPTRTSSQLYDKKKRAYDKIFCALVDMENTVNHIIKE